MQEYIEDTLYVVMPAYNEEDNITDVVKKWYPVLENASEESRLVVADSGSTDKTHALLEELQESYPKLVILPDTLRYHGPKVISLYKYAIENKAEYVFQTDSDDQTDPKDFAGFWAERKNYDAIIGHRAERGDGFFRAIVEKALCVILYLFFQIRVPDANTPYRLLRCDVLQKYIDRIPYDHNLPNILVTIFFVYYKDRVAFRKIAFRQRMAGSSMYDIKKIANFGLQCLRDFAKLRREL